MSEFYSTAESLIKIKQAAKQLSEELAPPNPNCAAVHAHARLIALEALRIVEWAKTQ